MNCDFWMWERTRKHTHAQTELSYVYHKHKYSWYVQLTKFWLKEETVSVPWASYWKLLMTVHSYTYLLPGRYPMPGFKKNRATDNIQKEYKRSFVLHHILWSICICISSSCILFEYREMIGLADVVILVTCWRHPIQTVTGTLAIVDIIIF
jgi:hypothetical protein